MQVDDFVLVVDPRPDRLEHSLMMPDLSRDGGLSLEEVAQVYLSTDVPAKVLMYRYRIPPLREKRPLSWFFPSCVTAMKAILSDNSWCFTPYQLYARLVRFGALEVYKNTMVMEMGGKPDTSKQEKEAAMQREEARRQKEAALKLQQSQAAEARRGERGRTSLISTSELGVTSKLG